MKKAFVAVAVVGIVGIVGFLLLGRTQGPTLPGSGGLFGIFPPVPAETRSIEEIKAATGDAAAAVRREALRSLGRLEDHRKLPASEVLPFLTKGARDSDAHVRAVATAYLGHIRIDPAQVVSLLATLLKDPDALVRMNAAGGLRLRGAAAHEALPALLEAQMDVDRDVRINVASALLHFPDLRYEPPDDWTRLSKEEAVGRARGMGLSITGNSLHQAVQDDDLAAVFLLLKAGVDPNSRSTETKAGETPLFRVAGRRIEIVRLLLQAGADVHLKDNFGKTSWDWVKHAEGPRGEELQRLLRDAGGAT